MDGLLSNGLHEKVMIYMLLKVDQMHSLLRKSPWQRLLANNMKEEELEQNY